MIFVLYKNNGCHSGRALRKALSELPLTETVRGGYPKRFEKIMAKEGVPQVVINLGTTDETSFTGKMLNTPDMIRAGSNKKKARQIFAENDVPSPKLFNTSLEVSADELPVIGRTSYHSKGSGFWFCKTMAAVRSAQNDGATHFMQFIPNTREYRVHTFLKSKYWPERPGELDHSHYVSTKISEKVWVGDDAPDPNEPQKNHTFGWTFLGPQDRREEELDVIRHAAKMAIASLGMDFGAVDVMYRVRNKLAYVLEVNSTPSLADENSDTCERYAKRILKTVGMSEEEEE